MRKCITYRIQFGKHQRSLSFEPYQSENCIFHQYICQFPVILYNILNQVVSSIFQIFFIKVVKLQKRKVRSNNLSSKLLRGHLASDLNFAAAYFANVLLETLSPYCSQNISTLKIDPKTALKWHCHLTHHKWLELSTVAKQQFSGILWIQHQRCQL